MCLRHQCSMVRSLDCPQILRTVGTESKKSHEGSPLVARMDSNGKAEHDYYMVSTMAQDWEDLWKIYRRVLRGNDHMFPEL